MDYIEIKQTLDALNKAVEDALIADGDANNTDNYNKSVSTINIEFERLRDLLGY